MLRGGRIGIGLRGCDLVVVVWRYGGEMGLVA